MRARHFWIVLLAALPARATESNVNPVTRPASLSWWREQGFVELQPPLRLPTDVGEHDHITVWIKIPAGAKMRTSIVDGRATLTMPPGTIADRIELDDDRITDVRGTQFTADGEWFHDYRPHVGKLDGWQWLRGDEKASLFATERLLTLVEEPGRARFRRLNDCGGCHLHDRADRTRVSDGMPFRGSDASGLFVPLTVLRDSAPLDNHRPRDRNADDRFVRVRCGGTITPAHDDGGGARHYLCADGSVPIGELAVAAALAAGDEHARAVCTSRRYLRDHLDDAGRRAFAAAFAACSL
jgi:hypothetical protein